MSDSKQAILKQVEFYFSDSNLPKDKFIMQHLSENDGWFTIETLLKFPRVKKLTEDVSGIVEALKDSSKLTLSEDSTKLKRNDPIDDVDTTDATIYVKGFAKESSLDDVTEILTNAGLSVKCVRMRYYIAGEGKNFKGSVFAELSSADEAASAVSKSIKVGDADLLIMSKSDYMKSKNNKGGDSKPAEPIFSPMEFVADHLLKVTNIGADCSREILKEWLAKVDAVVAYSDFSRGQSEAILRLTEDSPVKAKDAIEKLTPMAEEFKTNDLVPVFTAYTEEEEKQIWEKIEESRKERRMLPQKRGFQKRGGNKGNKRVRRN